jgi:hypothetical protein
MLVRPYLRNNYKVGYDGSPDGPGYLAWLCVWWAELVGIYMYRTPY